MADKTPAEKMRAKPGMTAVLVHVPAELEGRIGVPEGVEILPDPAEADFLLDFATTQAEAQERMTSLKPYVREKSRLWIGYPKGSKAAGHDLSRDTIAAFAPDVGLVVNASVSIDDKWSAVGMRLI